MNCDVIKGNADEWVVRGVREGEVPDPALEMMNKERDWTVSELVEKDIEYLSDLPTELNLHLAHCASTLFTQHQKVYLR